jgi:Protein kinase domain/PEGA domain
MEQASMPTRIGPFEIVSELAKSPTSTVYKANDPASGQTVALKTVQLSAFGEHAAALEQALLQEAESVKVLSSPNLTTVSNPGVADGQFYAAMEYVQGNSIATMLARKEGFSIWDLLDIGRQLCAGLDHAASHHIVHYSLEPSKIMCGWDGTVKILGFGASSVGTFAQHAGDFSSVLHYMSPEQIRGEATDGRSNLFSLGAIFYEMVTEKKAFDGADIDSVRNSILEGTPVPPIQLNAKVHPLLSDLIIKALAKDPAKRYQNGKELLTDLENCKEVRPPAKKAPVATGTVASEAARAAAQSRFLGAAAQKSPTPPTPAVSVPAATVAPKQPVPRPAPPVAAASKPMAARPVQSTPAPPKVAGVNVQPPPPHPTSRLAMPKTAAASAGVGVPSVPGTPQFDVEQPTAYMSAPVEDEPLVETFESGNAGRPQIAVDPMMAEGAAPADGAGRFSEISELPPLKEVYIAPDPVPAETEVQAPVYASTMRAAAKTPQKPKVQPRVAAQQAIKEIKAVPPQLMMYSLAAAAVLILVIGIGVTFYIHSQSDDDSGSSRPAPAAVQPAAQPETQAAPRQPAQADAQPVEIQDSSPAPVEETAATPRTRGAGRKQAKAALIPAQLTIDSTPQGAEVQFDGSSDPSWTTPITLQNVQPGQHSITITKAGYSPGSRSVDVASGARASTVVHLSQLTATLMVKSDPAGANVFLDNHDTGTKTPAQISVAKGQHLVTVRMNGYLEESTTATAVLGQTVGFSPSLRPLGNVDNLKTVGKVSKLFHKGADSTQGVLSIHTQPKGAQIAINQHMLDKNSPVDVALDPGNYVIDINLSGYAPVHKVITTERGAKVTLDEVLQPQ